MSASAGQNVPPWLRHPAVQIALLAIATWGLLGLLNRLLGPLVVTLLVLAAGLAAVVNYMLRYRRAQLAAAYRYPGAKHFIDLVCRATSLQPPTERTQAEEAPQDELQLKNEADFAALAGRLKEKVRGHDQVILAIIEQLKTNLALRSASRQKKDLPPLAVLALAGPPGIGKRYLARLLGRSVYKQGALLEIDLAQVAGESPAGPVEETIIQAVKSRPYHAIILDNIETVPPAVTRRLEEAFAHGATLDPATGARVSFEHCIFFLLASRGLDGLRDARQRATGRRDWNQRAHEVLSREGALSPTALAHIDEVFLLDAPSKLHQAEVVVLLIERECRKYNVALEGIDPQLLAQEVAAVTSEQGFAGAVPRVERLVRDPLLRATRTKAAKIFLRQNEITLAALPEFSDR